jgi:hypothetical protein
LRILKIKSIAGILLSGTLLISCQHEPELIPGTAEVCFNTDVMLIINSNCNISGCHNGSGEAPSLVNYADVLRFVTPGQPMKSELYKVVNKHPDRLNVMPPKPKPHLNNSQLNLLSLWILQGAKDDPNCVSSQ